MYSFSDVILCTWFFKFSYLHGFDRITADTWSAVAMGKVGANIYDFCRNNRYKGSGVLLTKHREHKQLETSRNSFRLGRPGSINVTYSL